MPRPDKLRQKARAIIDAALDAVNPALAVQRAVNVNGSTLMVAGRRFDLDNYKRIVCVGAGKAGQPMASALEGLLGSRLALGKVVVKDGHGGPTEAVEIMESSHPVPDERGVAAGKAIAELLAAKAGPDTLVFCLLSGGGSALMPAPAEGVSLVDKQQVTKLLLASGADIGEINAIRKHLSQLKGGNLARLAGDSTLITLIISDVVGDYLDVIASGPTVPDTSTWDDCKEILDRYGIWDKAPEGVRTRIQGGLDGNIPDTPKPGEDVLDRAVNLIIASNRQAVDAAAEAAKAQGLASMVLSTTIEGETKDIARMHVAIAREALASGQPLAPPCCILSGGETTVQLGDSDGLGGRNQEFALAAALDMAGMKGVLALSLGTDGTDGPTDAAGAWADGQTVERAAAAGMNTRDYLARHDAYHYFQALDDLLITGPTRTNVMDVRAVLVDPS